MNTPVLAVALLAAGVLAAVVGLVVSVLMARRRLGEGTGPRERADLGFVVMITGLAVAIIRGGDSVFLLLTT
jgi:hypothetical protein